MAGRGDARRQRLQARGRPLRRMSARAHTRRALSAPQAADRAGGRRGRCADRPACGPQADRAAAAAPGPARRRRGRRCQAREGAVGADAGDAARREPLQPIPGAGRAPRWLPPLPQPRQRAHARAPRLARAGCGRAALRRRRQSPASAPIVPWPCHVPCTHPRPAFCGPRPPARQAARAAGRRARSRPLTPEHSATHAPRTRSAHAGRRAPPCRGPPVRRVPLSIPLPNLNLS